MEQLELKADEEGSKLPLSLKDWMRHPPWPAQSGHTSVNTSLFWKLPQTLAAHALFVSSLGNAFSKILTM